MKANDMQTGKIERHPEKMEIVCPAGTPASLKAAIAAGADTIYCGFRDETNARNFPGLNFSEAEMEESILLAHRNGCKVLIAINTYPQAGNIDPWYRAIDNAAKFSADAIILADLGLLDYAKRKHPNLRLHLSVQAAAANPVSINYYAETFNVKRVVLPRILSIQEVTALNKRISVETEVFAFGGLCVMAEGRCALSSYATGKSPNMHGVCSPASHAKYINTPGGTLSRLGDVTINKFGKGEAVGYPTLCKGRFIANAETSYLFEEPTSLSTISMLPELMQAGVTAIKIEGRQRGKAYVSAVVETFRNAVNKAVRGETIDASALLSFTEGGKNTKGAYDKKWR